MRRPFIVLALLGISLAACDKSTAPPSYPVPLIDTTTFAASLNVDVKSMTKSTTGLYYADSVVGTGATAAAGDSVWVTYTGWLVDGTMFDSNADTTAYPFRLGDAGIIQGFNEGVTGMKVGSWRKLVIPPSLGYGDQWVGPIHPNSILVFNVKVDSVK